MSIAGVHVWHRPLGIHALHKQECNEMLKCKLVSQKKTKNQKYDFGCEQADARGGGERDEVEERDGAEECDGVEGGWGGGRRTSMSAGRSSDVDALCSWEEGGSANLVAAGLQSGRGGRKRVKGAPLVGPFADWAGKLGLPASTPWYFPAASCQATSPFHHRYFLLCGKLATASANRRARSLSPAPRVACR